MVSDGVGSTTVDQSLVFSESAGGTRGRECVYGVRLVWRGGWGGGGGWVCSPTVHVPFGGSTEGAPRVLRVLRDSKVALAA